jgi:TPR repeat protein
MIKSSLIIINKMEHLKGISFAGLIPVDSLDVVLHKLKSSTIFSHLDDKLSLVDGSPTLVEKDKVPPSNGFMYIACSVYSCLLYAMMFEHGHDKLPPDFKRSYDFYKLGVTNYFNPLAAYRLASIYADPTSSTKFHVKPDKAKSFAYLLLSQ